jgi:hypothetical protein
LPKEKVQTADDLERHFPASDLTALLDEIDNLLYNKGASEAPWRGKNLLEAIEKIRKTGKQKKKKGTALEKLYK